LANAIKKILYITLGTAIMAFGVINFSVTSYLASGGVTGLSLILFHQFGIGTGVSTFLLNIPLLIVYYRFTNRAVFLYTIFGISAVSGFLSLFEWIGPIMPCLQNDMILAAIGFGVTVGVGSGMILQYDGTTGGAAIVARLLKDFFHIPISKSFLIIDSAIIIASFFFFLTITDGIYSILAAWITAVTLAKYQEGFIVGYKVLIFSDHYEEISQFIIKDLDRGVTFVKGTGGYSKEEKQVILTIIDRKQIVSLKKGVGQIDPGCFMSISHTYETLGEGFSFEQNMYGVKK
jgi:uncharacterized membrane-anchored protein YitT (DUF2179 family)